MLVRVFVNIAERISFRIIRYRIVFKNIKIKINFFIININCGLFKIKNMKIFVGNYVLLYHTMNKKWLVKVEEEKKMHTHLGIIDISSLIGLEYGISINTSLNKKIYLIEPTIHDYIMKSERNTQIILSKRPRIYSYRSGIQNGSKVLEMGPGSGDFNYISS